MRKKTLLIAAAIILLLLSVSISARLSQPVQAQGFGSWTAQFFNNANFNPPAVAAIYPNGLNFVWTGLPLQADGITPVPGITLQDGFSVIFSTSVALGPGNYTFSGTADDQITVIINGQTVYQTSEPPDQDFSFVVPLASAGPHSIQVRFQEFGGQAVLNLSWAAGGVIVSPTPEGPLGTVRQVRGLSLRTGPYLGASFIAVLRPDNDYPVLASNDTEGGPYTWYQVRVNNNRVGWASGRYLRVTKQGQVQPATTIFEELTDPPETGVIAVPRAIMNLRRYPSERADLLAQIPWGAEVPLLNRTIQGGRNHWFQVRYNGIVGWIYAPYVGVRGNIDAVPIR